MRYFLGHLVFVLIYLTQFTHGATCYNQAGSPQGSNVQPCNSTTNTGACCNVAGGDIRTESGLCMRQGEIPGFLYQDACTDSQWGSECPNFCPSMYSDMRSDPYPTDKMLEKQNGPWVVLQCSDDPAPGSWCCTEPGENAWLENIFHWLIFWNSGGSNCCSDSSQVFTTNVGALIIPTSTMSATVATTTGTSAPSTALDCPKDKSATIGGSIGGALGAALLATLGLLFWRERTRPKLSEQWPSADAAPAMISKDDASRAEMSSWNASNPTTEAHELQGLMRDQ
jgi:hypothetical protein